MSSQHYSLGDAELTFGGKTTGIKNLLVVFDSGSSYSYFNLQAYEALTYLVSKKQFNLILQSLVLN